MSDGTLDNFLNSSAVSKVASQVDTFLPDEKKKELLRDQIGPLVKKIHPKLGEKITEELMKMELPKLAQLAEDDKKLEAAVNEEAKKIEEEEKKAEAENVE